MNLQDFENIAQRTIFEVMNSKASTKAIINDVNGINNHIANGLNNHVVNDL